MADNNALRYSDSDNEVLSTYLKAIDKIPLLTYEEEYDLALKAKNGDKKARERLINSNLRFVVSVAKKFRGQGIPLEDLINEGNIGLMTAVDKFEPEKGYHFISYAVWWVRQAILKALAEQSRPVRLPLNRSNELIQIVRAKNELLKSGENSDPSAEDIAKAVDKVPARNVFVLPNNKNIVLAAEQAKNLTNKYIYVIPTTSVPEGISAVLGFNMDGTLEENMEAMMNGKDAVTSASVTYAVRTTHVDGFDLTQGDIIGLDGKGIIAKGNLVKDTTMQLLDKLVTPEAVNITLFYGNEMKEEEAQALLKEVEQKYDQCDVTLLYGGQPVYYYIISIE